MCKGLRGLYFWFWSRRLKPQAPPGRRRWVWEELPHRSAPLGNGQDAPGGIKQNMASRRGPRRVWTPDPDRGFQAMRTNHLAKGKIPLAELPWRMINGVSLECHCPNKSEGKRPRLGFSLEGSIRRVCQDLFDSLTKSDDCLLSSHMVAIPCTVVLTSGSVCSRVASLVVPFVVGGGRCREMGVLGIQPP